MKRTCLLPTTWLIAVSAPAAAQNAAGETTAPPVVTVSGSATIASDYRFRGVSQTDQEMAVQGGITIQHGSGIYAGVWGSNLAGWGTFGGANMELDLIGGVKLPVGAGAMLDVGLTWYMYPGGAERTDFAEPYAKLSGTTGPATLTAGAAYAPRQQALGRWYRTRADAAAGAYTDPGAKGDNLYLWGDAAIAVAGTPITARRMSATAGDAVSDVVACGLCTIPYARAENGTAFGGRHGVSGFEQRWRQTAWRHATPPGCRSQQCLCFHHPDG